MDNFSHIHHARPENSQPENHESAGLLPLQKHFQIRNQFRILRWKHSRQLSLRIKSAPPPDSPTLPTEPLATRFSTRVKESPRNLISKGERAAAPCWTRLENGITGSQKRTICRSSEITKATVSAVQLERDTQLTAGHGQSPSIPQPTPRIKISLLQPLKLHYKAVQSVTIIRSEHNQDIQSHVEQI